MLARSGLLDGRSATTHWSSAKSFAARYPAVRLEADKPIVDDGDLITTAGLMAWSELGLRLVDRLMGPSIAADTARFLVIEHSDSASQCGSNFAPILGHGDAAILKVQHWLQASGAVDVSLAAMAREAGLEERTFLRRFRNATGLKPTEYCQHLRVGKARQMLEFTNGTIDHIAWTVGDHVVQVLLQHHAFAKAFRGIRSRQHRFEFIQAVDNFLPSARAGVHGFQTDGSTVEQARGGWARVFQCENAQAVQHDFTDTLAEQCRPTFGRFGFRAEQTMADGFGADEIVVNVPAPQILRPRDIERSRLGRADQGLCGQQVQRQPRVQISVITATELEPEDLRQPARQGAVGFDFMQGRALTCGVSDYQLLALNRGHASPLAIPPCVYTERCRDQAKALSGRNTFKSTSC
jgi:AraC-like DNA-binding protein